MRLFTTFALVLTLGVFAAAPMAFAAGTPTCKSGDSFGIAPSTAAVPVAQDHNARDRYGVSNGDSDTIGACRLPTPRTTDASLH